MPLKKLLGVFIMAAGIGWDSQIKMLDQAARALSHPLKLSKCSCLMDLSPKESRERQQYMTSAEILKLCHVLQSMPVKKLLGLFIMAAGIGWYSQIKMSEQANPASITLSSSAKTFPELRGSSNSSAVRARSPDQPRAASPSTDASEGALEEQADSGKGGMGLAGRNWTGHTVSPRRAKQFDRPFG
jgi:hypothetical protein